MKIVHVITSLGFGGAEKLLLEVANRQSTSNEVHVIYYRIPKLNNLFDSKVTLHEVPMDKKVIWSTYKKIKSINPDVVHTHLTHGDFFGLTAASFIKNVKKVCTIHNTRYRESDLTNGFFTFAYIILLNIIARKSKVIAISNNLLSQINTQLKVSKDRIKLLYNTVPVQSSNKSIEEIAKEHKINIDKVNFLFIGRLSVQKSVHTLIDAVSKLNPEVLRKINVLIVGEGEKEYELKEQIKSNNLENVVFLKGTTTEVPDYYKAADAFILPSIFEGMPLVVIEALSAGIPILSSDIEGPRELIKNGENGFLFEKQNSDALAKLITRLVENDNTLLSLQKGAVETYQKKFNINKYIVSLEDIYA